MTNNPSQPNIATIRQLLLAAFTPEELRRFCYDRPTFRPIVDLFGPGHGFSVMADQVVEYCDRHLLLDQLLAEVKQINPGQYARFFEPALEVVTLEKPPAETVAKPVLDKPSTARSPAKVIPMPRSDEPAPPVSEILTLTSPIHLELVHIPAGEFKMGSDKTHDKDATDDEFPQHSVHVPEFYIGKYPVTNEQYQVFAHATGSRAPAHWKSSEELPSGKARHPVVDVSWRNAVAFCTWLSKTTGQPFRLPTEAEWEKAARGMEDARIYPWGDESPDEGVWCNYGHETWDTSEVGQYSPYGDSPYGCADMAGNVWEWCQSLHKPYPYQADDGREDLKARGYRVFRGGSWRDSPELVRCACRSRHDPDFWFVNYGFRVARGPLG